MKPLSEHMGMYSAYHRHPMNRIIHFIFVPAIVWTLMVWMDLLQFDIGGTSLSLAMFVTAALVIWYIVMDYALGVASAFVFTVLLVTAIWMNAVLDDAALSAMIAGGVFVGSWIFQFLGHGVWEKRRPALFDNIFQTLIAPMFLIAETAFAMGMKQDLQQDVHGEMEKHRPKAKGAPA